ncbi:MAG: NUDIX hydrolase [Microthrixaceae bacterium]|nr:NUDIX hydrolase [Acidimicrobiales bacterium]MCB9404831.1 NUDIX hydrolase [Microthrixaceae bacterium]
MGDFRHIADREIASLARCTVVQATFAAPDGTTFERDVIRNLDVVAMVPVHEDLTVSLVRQYRGPVDEHLLEIPAGLCDLEGETPEATAARELHEELGMRAASLDLVAQYYPAAGFADQFVRLFIATDLTIGEPEREGVEEQHMTEERIALDQVASLIADGTIRDSKTIIGLLLARDRFLSSR